MSKVGADDFIAATGATAETLNGLPRENIMSARPTQAELLVRLAADAELFHTPDGDIAYATIPVTSHHETWPIRSRGFRRWMVRRFYDAHGKPPSAQAVADALGVLEARAQFDGNTSELFVRIAGDDQKIYFDLADEHWHAVEITAAGWRVVSNPPVKFRRPRGMLPLPCPVEGGTLRELRRFVNVENDNDWQLLIGWLVAALRPTGPYPILVFHGEQGAAKSTTEEVLRCMIDPNTAPLRAEPTDVRDMMIAASNGWCLAFDNLSHLTPWLSDALCRLATGGGFATRELFTDGEEMLFNAQRPVMFNGIEELVTRGDLLDRAIILYLPQIPDENRRSENDFWREFEKARPRILGALLDGVTAALRGVRAVRLKQLPRMADFAAWVTAAEPALGWHDGTFLMTYAANRSAANDLALESSPVAAPVRDFACAAGWTGTATDLLNELTKRADEASKLQKGWPKTPQGLSNVLRRLAPNLRAVGVTIKFGQREPGTGRRLIEVRTGHPLDCHSRHNRHDGEPGGDDPRDGVTIQTRSAPANPPPDGGCDACDDRDAKIPARSADGHPLEEVDLA